MAKWSTNRHPRYGTRTRGRISGRMLALAVLLAARELRNHVNGHDLKCESSRHDQYNRVLAICFLPDGSDVNAWMVRQGWAVAFRTTKRYRPEQDDAAAAKRGLWAGAFAMPWEWRDRNRR